MLEVVKPSATDNPHGQRLTVILNGELINVSALARELDMKQGYLSKVLSGKIQPTARNLKKIAEALEMSMEELVTAIELRQILAS